MGILTIVKVSALWSAGLLAMIFGVGISFERFAPDTSDADYAAILIMVLVALFVGCGLILVGAAML